MVEMLPAWRYLMHEGRRFRVRRGEVGQWDVMMEKKNLRGWAHVRKGDLRTEILTKAAAMAESHTLRVQRRGLRGER